MFGMGPIELLVFCVIVTLAFSGSRIPELMERRPRGRVYVRALKTSTLVAAALLLIVIITIAVLLLSTRFR